MIPTKTKQEFQVGIDLLVDILNGKKAAVIDMPDYNRRF